MMSEARIAQRAGCAVAIGGGLPSGARKMAQRLIEDGVTGLISFGLAGGLDPALPAGTLVVPHAILHQGTEFRCDPGLVQMLSDEAQVVGWLLAGDEVVATAAEKGALWRSTGAAAVDLESGAVAMVAAAHGLPFAALRAICDPAGRNLPSAAVQALDETGRVVPMKMAGQLARHPQQIFGLIALGRDAARARRALVRGAERLRTLTPGDTHLG
jgi:adenosylhomocysteine nucleosidase